MMANRFLPAVCLLLALALVPTIIHSYSDSTVHDGLTTASVPTTLAGYEGTPSGRNATWGERRFQSFDWFERVYTAPGDEVTLSVVRSFDPKSVYHHPELAAAYGPSWTREVVRSFPDRSGVPVHVLQTSTGDAAALYVLRYDDRFVADPIPFQLRTSLELLFSGRKAMTLFFITDESVPPSLDPERLPSVPLLFAAIDAFLAAAPAAR